jgi:hypothetical protein
MGYDAVMGAVWLLLAWAIWFYAWEPFCADLLRQRLFDLRADLFDLAAQGRVDFDSPAYYGLRLRLNALIWGARRITWPRSFFMIWAVREQASDLLAESEDWLGSVRGLPADVAEEIRRIHGGVVRAIAMRLAPGALVVALCCVPLYFFQRLFGGMTVSERTRREISERARVIEGATVREYAAEAAVQARATA